MGERTSLIVGHGRKYAELAHAAQGVSCSGSVVSISGLHIGTLSKTNCCYVYQLAQHRCMHAAVIGMMALHGGVFKAALALSARLQCTSISQQGAIQLYGMHSNS